MFLNMVITKGMLWFAFLELFFIALCMGIGFAKSTADEEHFTEASLIGFLIPFSIFMWIFVLGFFEPYKYQQAEKIEKEANSRIQNVIETYISDFNTTASFSTPEVSVDVSNFITGQKELVCKDRSTGIKKDFVLNPDLSYQEIGIVARDENNDEKEIPNAIDSQAQKDLKKWGRHLDLESWSTENGRFDVEKLNTGKKILHYTDRKTGGEIEYLIKPDSTLEVIKTVEGHESD